MLERFKVPREDQVRVPEDSLRITVTAIFEKMGVSREDAKQAADVLTLTDLRGVETHGVSNMLRDYVSLYNEGNLNPRPSWRIVRESPGTATIDADNGLAIILGPKAMRLAIEKARKVGVGIVTMFNSGHSGAIGHHCMLAVQEDMVGMCTTAGGAVVVPTYGSEGRLGTNPIAIAAPAGKEAPIIFDAATSAIAGNKIRLAQRVDADMLAGWISELDGTPIMKEVPVRERGEYHHLPMGGSREQGSHKGYGFGLMSEILATMLAGALPTMLDEDAGSRHYFAAYNISAFTDVDTFKHNMDKMLKMLKETPPAPGYERVLYPGLSENEEMIERRLNGIPLHKEVVEWFDDISSELNVPRLQRI